MREKVRTLVDADRFQIAVNLVIVFNAVLLGLRTAPLDPRVMLGVILLDRLCVLFYTIEIALRIYAYRSEYFRVSWNIFDFAIVAVSIIPTSIIPIPANVVRVLRVIRAFRLFRLISGVKQLRVIVEATVHSIPGVLWTACLMFIVMYVYAIIGTLSFADKVPQYFGDLGRTMYTLFEVMTLEGWNGVAEETMAVAGWAWLYFLTYVIVSAFVLMNVVVGIIVESVEDCQHKLGDLTLSPNMQSASEDNTDPDALLNAKLAELQVQMDELRNLLEKRKSSEVSR